ncbi:putative uncharacterized protein MYH16 [Patella vulgata]|uniref:putative uncharacterized protein MYH16 n=1 Tax=Patella vulgata TaxID=6465 RepID=UPI0021806C70|nr:putative uncharacterized protein MYH16 [Patella vulgata]
MEVSKVAVPKDDARIIQQNFAYLENNIEPRDLTSYLFAVFVFDAHDKSRINGIKDRKERTHKFINILLRRGEKALGCFIEALQQSSYWEIARKLRAEIKASAARAQTDSERTSPSASSRGALTLPPITLTTAIYHSSRNDVHSPSSLSPVHDGDKRSSSELYEKLNEHEARLSGQRKEITRLTNNNERLREENSEKIKDENKMLYKRVEEQQALIEEKQVIIDEKQAIIDELRREVRTQDIHDKLDQKNKEIDKLKAQISESQTELRKKVIEEELGKIEVNIENLGGVTSRLETGISQLNELVDHGKTQQENHKQDGHVTQSKVCVVM